ncbi:MAG: VCBS repeat-containing protein, partial [Candidatus Eremiobacterota bacterium]
FRFIGFDPTGRAVFGAERRARAASVTLTVPVTVTRLRIEYLQGETIVGLFEIDVALTAGQTLVINDPDWVDLGVQTQPSRLAFTVQPVNGAPNTPLAAVQVTIQDSQGNPVTTAANPITLSLASDPVGAVLGGTLTVDPINGVATFSNLTINRGGTYTLGAFADGIVGAVSDPFTISAEPIPTTLNFVASPTSGIAGQVLTPTQVEVLDQFGARFNTNANLTVGLGSNPSGATLGGTTTQACSAGLATFSDLAINRPGTGYTLSATGAGAAPATSTPFDVTLTPVGGTSRSVACPMGGGNETRSLATADFNGDGRADGVAADVRLGVVTVMLSQADGGYKPRQMPVNVGVPPGGAVSQPVAAADFDQDGNQDIATLSVSNGVLSFLKGNGNGTFQAPVTTALAAMVTWQDMEAGSMNSNVDNLPDVVISSQFLGASVVVVATFNPGGTFTELAAVTMGADAGARGLALGNLDADNDLDVVVANRGSNTVTPLTNDGTGTLAVGTAQASGTTQPTSVVLAPVDAGNAVLDAVVACNGGGNVRVLLGDGAGGLMAVDGTAYLAANNDNLSTLSTGDLDGDGDQDLAVADGPQLFATGTGVNVLLNQNSAAAPFFGAATLAATGQSCRISATGDANGDGRADVFTIEENFARFVVALGNANGTLAYPQLASFTSYVDVTTADFNGDGRQDLAGLTTTGADHVDIFLQQAGGGYPAAPDESTAGGGTLERLVASDFDGDGRVDLGFTDEATDQFRVVLNSAMGPPFFGGMSQDTGLGLSPAGLAVGNLDAGTLPDVVVGRGGTADPPTVAVCVNTSIPGTVTFTVTPMGLGGETNVGVVQLAVGDFNGDGRQDLIAPNGMNLGGVLSTPAVKVAFGDGAGAFLPPITIAITVLDANVIAIGDLDGDGDLDIAVSNNANPQIELILGDGAGGVVAQQGFSHPTVAFAQQMAIRDVNQDNLPDLVT